MEEKEKLIETYQADFNGDALQDIVVLVIEKATQKKGLLLIHGKNKDFFLKLSRPGILIEDYEDGEGLAGGIIIL